LRRSETIRIVIDGAEAVGIWSTQDSPAIRAAIRIAGWPGPIRYLDGRGIPDKYKGTRLPDDPPPLAVVDEMQANIDGEPWTIRDRRMAGVRVIDLADLETEVQRQMAARGEEQRRILAAGGVLVPTEAEPVGHTPDEWRRVGEGWATFSLWTRWDPIAARAERARHASGAAAGEAAWLLSLGELRSPGRRLRLLLERLEEALEQARQAIASSPDRETAGRRFAVEFHNALERMRGHPTGAPDSFLDASHRALERMLRVLKELHREIAGESLLSGLFGETEEKGDQR
jgi:hypothetical protein